MLGLLYDIHGNLPALEAVLEQAEREGVDRWLLGGDFAALAPWPLDTLERLRALPESTWIRGNGERWLREPPMDRPDVMEALSGVESGLGSEEGWLYSLQTGYELHRVLYVHGSPLSDVESFAPEPEEGEERMLLDVRDRTVVFGHSHQQFRRPGPNGTELLNPGSVGMPLDGDVRAAWAVRRDDGDFEFRRTEYDVERAVAGWKSLQGGFSELAAERVARGSD
ncbi:MAG TPA: metallophosphoesterase family protein [Gaiellaceae bacterium]|nr:metallophosphoesterase family protein [Gaiellaceae bacterium]